MKRKLITDIRSKSLKELEKEGELVRMELMKLNASKNTKPLKNTREPKALRKRLAVILTMLRARTLDSDL
jgi:ribosomal protein L29